MSLNTDLETGVRPANAVTLQGERTLRSKPPTTLTSAQNLLSLTGARSHRVLQQALLDLLGGHLQADEVWLVSGSPRVGSPDGAARHEREEACEVCLWQADMPQILPVSRRLLPPWVGSRLLPDSDPEAAATVSGYWTCTVDLSAIGLASCLIGRGKPLSHSERSNIEALLAIYLNVYQLLDDAGTDVLTGLPNRRSFDQRLPDLLQQPPMAPALQGDRRSDPEPGDHWLAMIDVDHFKRVNDEHGHAQGDAVLQWIARILRCSFRQGDAVFRIGGEEFVVLLNGLTRAQAERALHRFRQTVADTDFPSVGRVTLSIGVVRAVPESAADVLLARADEALYTAKRAGRNRLQLR